MKSSSRSRGQVFILVALLVVMVLSAGYWVSTNLRWEEREVDQGYSRAARQNDFLAAELLLRNHGIASTSIKNLSLLDEHQWRGQRLGNNDTLILIDAYKTLNQARYKRLYKWLENGGTLIVSPLNPYIGSHTQAADLLLRDFNITPASPQKPAKTNPLLDFLTDQHKPKQGAETEPDHTSAKNTEPDNAGSPELNKPTENTAKNTQPGNAKENQKEKEKEKPDNYYRCSLNKEPTEMAFAQEPKPLLFDFSHEAPFTHERNNEPGQDNNNLESNMLSFFVGEGRLTVTSDPFIWSNRRIDCHDHAYALWRLVNHHGRVWFLINQDAPSLSTLLWRNTPYAVLAAVIALALWLWAQSQRFGPTLAYLQQGRRRLAEHIYASAMLLWRHQQHPQLVALLRQQTLKRLIAQQPQLADDNHTQQIEFLQTLTGLPTEAISVALYSQDLAHPQDFANAIAHLQTIRNHL